MSTPHAPHLRYLCDDPDCCDNGCPDVTCHACGANWPCPDWISRHSRTRVIAQHRWVARKQFPGDDRMVEYVVRRAAEQETST